MRVLFIAPFDLTIRDGTSIRVLNLARAAAQICEHVFLASYTSDESFKELDNLTHIKIRSVQLRYHFVGAFMNKVSPQITSRVAAKLLGLTSVEASVMKRVDLIHLHWLLHSYIAKSFQLLIGQEIPLVADLHGSFRIQEPPKGSMKGALAHALSYLHESIAIKDNSIKAFTVPSKSFGNFLASTYGISLAKIFEVRDFVEPETLASARRCGEIDEEVRKLLGNNIALHGFVAYAGAVSTYHGFFDLVEAFKIAEKLSRKELRLLLIIPTSRQIAKFQKILPSNTVILENIPRRFILCLLRHASALVLPHRAGTQFDYIPSNKVYDYMLAGKPIIAYKTPAIEEMLSKYKMYILTEPNNPVALAKGIVKALELWKDSEPAPAYDVPTLEEAVKSLKVIYRIVSKVNSN